MFAGSKKSLELAPTAWKTWSELAFKKGMESIVLVVRKDEVDKHAI
jgi:hypothetical protein